MSETDRDAPHRRQSPRLRNGIGALFVLASMATSAAAAEYPLRPIRYIVPAAAGNAADTAARMLAIELSKQMGQQVVVDNRPGASGSIATDLVARAAPDGYTIGHGNILTLAINRSVLPKLPYDLEKDLQPVVQFGYSPNLLAVTPSLPVKSVRELIDYAKNNPDRLLYASPGSGSSAHVCGELFKLMTGTRIVHVPYKGSAQGITDLIAGQVHLMFDNLPAILPHVKSGKLRGLGMTGPKRSQAIPELPTIAEAGVPGFEVTAWSGVIVPSRVPKAIVARLNAETNRALASPAFIEKLSALSFEPVGGSPEQFAALIQKEYVKWAEVVKRSSVKMD